MNEYKGPKFETTVTITLDEMLDSLSSFKREGFAQNNFAFENSLTNGFELTNYLTLYLVVPEPRNQMGRKGPVAFCLNKSDARTLANSYTPAAQVHDITARVTVKPMLNYQKSAFADSSQWEEEAQ